MIFRLKELGISGNSLHVIHAFLTTRFINLKVNSYTHPAKICTTGLPQGSVLSTLLFIIYTRDMLSETVRKGLQYPDDCTVLFTGTDSRELQKTCQLNCTKIQPWIDT